MDDLLIVFAIMIALTSMGTLFAAFWGLMRFIGRKEREQLEALQPSMHHLQIMDQDWQ